jgi:branched-chain amino acid transport system ATP-binding protein
VHAVIGTNGAGKSTLINILSGEFPPSAGTVELLGQDVTAWPQPRRARAGLGRSYQRTTIFPSFTVLENCRLAAQARTPRPWALWESRRALPPATPRARPRARTGLADVLERPAGLLSHGQKRQLEIAMCLATAPQVLLLDEPLAGMGAEETDRMLALLAELKAGHAILLVEHDMDAVFRIADRITVMVNGASSRTARPRPCAANARCRPPTWAGTDDEHAPNPSSTPARSTPGTAAATCCTAWTCASPRRDRGPARPQRHGQEHADPHAAGPRAAARGPHPPVRRGLSRAPPARGGAPAAWPTCPRAAASSPTSACARTW